MQMRPDDFNWLTEEAALVKEPYFFNFFHDADERQLYRFEQEHGQLPKDYLSFVLAFGGARLFRFTGRYGIEINSCPRPAFDKVDGKEELFEFGLTSQLFTYVYFKRERGSAQLDAAVYVIRQGQAKKVHDSFAEWLRRSFKYMVREMRNFDWKRLWEYPAPFSKDELKTVEAIEKFEWEYLGRDNNGNPSFRVKNNSAGHLRSLTVGIRAIGKFCGGIRLDVASVGPGEEKVVTNSKYCEVYGADHDIQVFAMPLPLPEDRHYRWEF